MKKIFYFLIIFVSLFACVLLLPNKVNTSNVENLICSAETTPTTQNVNFYGSDNETLLYTAQVPYGSTLNSIESNNLFNINSENRINQGLKSYSISDNSVMILVNNGSLYSRLRYSVIDLNEYLGKTLYFKLKVSQQQNNLLSFRVFYTNENATTQEGSLSVQYIYSGELSFNVTIPSTFISGDNHYLGVAFYASLNTAIDNNTVLFNDIMISDYDVNYEPYYDDLTEYVNERYLKSAGVSDLSTPVSWSTSKESNNMFPFNVPITQDYNLYGYVNDGETITYEGELTSRVSDIGNYALTDIVSLNIEGKYVVRGSYVINSLNQSDFILMMPIFADSYTLNFSSVNALVFNSNSDYFDMNMLITSAPPNSSQVYNPSHISENMIGLNEISVIVQEQGSFAFVNFSFSSAEVGDVFYFYFSSTAFKLYESSIDSYTYTYWGFDEASKYTKDTNYMITENLDYLVDMNSNTNFSYSLITEDNKSPFVSHNTSEYLSYILFSQLTEYAPQSDEQVLISDCSLTVKVSYDDIVSFTNYSKIGVTCLRFNSLEYTNFDYEVDDYYFIVDKPTYRVNNALLLYNFDYYNTLYNVNSVIYELSKNGDYYDIVYNGTLPNYKYMYIDNEQINNTIFDRYIFVHFTFNNNNIINLLENGEYVPFYVGFDFNFAYYVEPLISDSSTFEYDFDKPKYKDTGDIFNINWLAVVYNIVVFIAFYFPLTALIFKALGLNYFLGGLLNVISFIFDNPLGNFLLGCLAFIIFFKILMWFWPIAWDYTKKGFTIISTNERRKAKKEYFKYANERRKQDYFKKRYEGEKISKIEKNRGVVRKGKPLKNKKSRK